MTTTSAPAAVSTRPTRKTRIVCISDTHNQTPKLPRGDVLIHAGDLTNQGSYSELKKAVKWISRQDFQAKVVIAGNHDITLDEPFFKEYQGSWKWPGDQDPTACRRLLVESESITYLENTTATVRLEGPRTWFTVFGSPCTPKHTQANWAFQYTPEGAEEIWDRIPQGTDIVVTHTPPKGHCDRAARDLKDEREGCSALLRKLEEIRPRLSICGHIHSGRGVQTLQWRTTKTSPLHQAIDSNIGSLVERVDVWNDPGMSNEKLSLVDLTIRSKSLRAGRGLGGHASLTRQSVPDSLPGRIRGQPDASLMPDETWHQPPSGDENLNPTSSLTTVALENNEALWGGGAEDQVLSNVGHGCPYEATQGVEEGWRGMPCADTEVARSERTTVVNAAYLGPRIGGKTVGYNKAIVVDVELPVWGSRDESEVADVG